MKDRGAITGQRFAYDLLPLIALIVISVTGLLLTFSSIFLHGGGYEFLAILHMVSVVFTLVYIPFGKFFHIVQRPAASACSCSSTRRRHGDGSRLPPLRGAHRHHAVRREPAGHHAGSETRLRRSGREYCPRCKRVLRGNAYLTQVKKGFK